VKAVLYGDAVIVFCKVTAAAMLKCAHLSHIYIGI